MNITDALSSSNIFTSIEQITREGGRRDYQAAQDQATPSGDTVDISDEAKKLYSEMIHKYDGASAGSGQNGSRAASGGTKGAGGTDQVEQLKKQIQSLKSQLMGLASQAQKNGMGNAVMSKMNTLQAQIAALEAQLQATGAAA